MKTTIHRQALMVTLALGLSTLTPLAHAQQAALPAAPSSGVVTLSGAQQQEYTRMLSSNVKALAAQAQLDPAEQAQVQQLTNTLDAFTAQLPSGLAPMSVSNTMIAPQGLASGLIGTQSLGAQQLGGVFGSGGLDSILQLLEIAASFIPGLGSILSGITGTIAGMIADTALIGQLMGMWQDVQKFFGMVQNLGGLTDLNGLLGDGSSLWNQISTAAGSYGVRLPTFNLNSIADVQRAVQVAQSGGLQGMLGSLDTLKSDPYGERLGLPGVQYADATNLDAAMGSILNRLRATDLANRNIHSAGASAEARTATDQLSREGAQTVGEVAADATQLAVTGTATMTELGATKVLIGAVTQGMKYDAMNASRMLNAFRQLTLASDANREVQGAILDNLVAERQDRVQAAEQKMNAEMAAREALARQNAAAAVAAGEVLGATKLDSTRVRSFGEIIEDSGN
ncbi:hypothetical protein [Deinococcus petrolearius]|uniref:Uncharacterized protein n=1 Tax=Deinococcus petrolearius TaxID=1751295 RepID=A0ABW1DN95_9DEIO